jgi:hypothetical protein
MFKVRWLALVGSGLIATNVEAASLHRQSIDPATADKPYNAAPKAAWLAGEAAAEAQQRLKNAPLDATSRAQNATLTMGNWGLACDNGWRCEALLDNPLGERNTSSPLQIIRLAGMHGALQLRFSIGAAEPDGKSFLPQMVEVSGSGFDYIDHLPEPIDYYGDGFVFGGETAAELLRKMAKGDSVRLFRKGGQSVTLPTRGLVDVLVHFDAVQKRVGHESAIFAKGNIHNTVPHPPPIPVIYVPANSSKPPRRLTPAQIFEERLTFHCSPDAKQISVPSDAYHVRLDERTTLALIEPTCSLSDYNDVARIILIDEAGQRRVAPIEGDSKVSGQLGARLVGGYWAESIGRLTSYSVSSSLCNSRTDYVWDGQGFRIVYQEQAASCKLEIHTLLTVWRATVEPQ